MEFLEMFAPVLYTFFFSLKSPTVKNSKYFYNNIRNCDFGRKNTTLASGSGVLFGASIFPEARLKNIQPRTCKSKTVGEEDKKRRNNLYKR